MTKRQTLAEFTAKAQAVHGTKYTYQGLEFINSKAWVRATCPEHGEVFQVATEHLRRSGCPACGHAQKGLDKRKTREQVISEMRVVHGDKYSYGDIKYRNSKSYIDITCPEHGIFEQNTSNHLSGKGCAKCGILKRGVATSYEDIIIKCRKAHGNKYSYGDTSLKNGKRYIDIICPKHGTFNQQIGHHTVGSGCKSCAAEAQGLRSRLEEDDTIARATDTHKGKYSYGDIVRSKDQTYIEVICPQHGKFNQILHNHLRGQGCYACGVSKVTEARTWTLEDFILKAQEIHGNKYKYLKLAKSNTNKSLVTYTCPKHGEITQLCNSHLDGHGCRDCGLYMPKISKGNKEISTVLCQQGVGLEMEYPITNTRKRMDIFIPSLKLGIEYNGNYWHSSQYKSNDAHKERSKLAEDRGIRLVHIFSHEWRLRRPAVETLLKRLCNVEVHKVAARKCKVVTPSKEVANAFLELNHIQGGARTGEFVGLEHEGKLVAVMVFNFNTSNRNEAADSTKVELTRYASSCTVVGGFSKLMKAWLKLNPVKTVVSYSDNRLFTGKVYELAGFKKIHTTQPDYKYLEPGWDDTLHHKSKYQKKHLVERFGVEACEGKTERQITEENSIYQVYDCGKTRWEFAV